MAVPTAVGWLGLRAPEVRRVLRMLASGCGVTAFAFAQHHGTVGAVVTTENQSLRDDQLPHLVRDKLAGIAYAHVRRRGAPVLSAQPAGDVVGGDWVLNGSAPWVTSWGVADVIGVAANTDDGRLLWALVDAAEGPGLSVAKSFDLMAYSATQTVALEFDGYVVPAERVLSVLDMDTWRTRDRLLAARPNPLCVGVGDRALVELAAIAPELGAELSPWWEGIAAAAEANSAAVDGALAGGKLDANSPEYTELIETVATARADTVLATQKLSTALLAATGGAAMELGHSAQRLSREALFYVIQAQSGDGRAAMLARLGPDEAP